VLDHLFETRWRNGQIVRRMFGITKRLPHGGKGSRVGVVAVHIAQQAAELLPRRSVETTVLLQAVLRPGFELVEPPPSLGDPDDRDRQRTALHHRLERRKDLLVGKVACSAKENESIGLDLGHEGPFVTNREMSIREIDEKARRFDS